jgi:hypothetical protein
VDVTGQMRGVKAETGGATWENRGVTAARLERAFRHTPRGVDGGQSAPLPCAGRTRDGNSSQLLSAGIPMGCCRRCDEVCAGNSGRCGVNAAQKRAASRPPQEGRQPRLGVSTSIPPGSRKRHGARLTRLGQIGEGLSVQVELPVIALHEASRWILEFVRPEQREAQLPADRVRRRVVDRREGMQVTTLPV